MGKLKLLCVGLDGKGKSDRNEAEASGEFTITGGVDVCSEARAGFESSSGRLAFDSLSEALNQTDADVALIATPDRFHAPYSIQAMEAGLDVICEKPMAETLADGRRMHETARRLGRMLMIHHQLRWHPSIHYGRKLIEEGAIGGVDSIEMDMFVFSTACLNGYRADLPHMVLQDLSIHHLDLIRYFSGEEVTKMYMTAWHPDEEGVNLTTTVAAYGVMDMSGGGRASYRANLRSIMDDTNYTCRTTVRGGKGTLRITKEKCELQTHKAFHAGKEPELIDPPAPERNVMQAFAHSIRTRTPALTDSSDNIKSLEALAKAIDSADRNR